METWVWILGAVAVHWIYKSYQENSPAKRMEKMEELAEKYFGEGVEKEKKTISEYTERMKKKELVFHGDEIIKKAEGRLKQLEDVQGMYLRLKERNKHASKNEKAKLLQDWFDYTCALRDVNSAFEMLNYDVTDKAYDNYGERTKEPIIKMQEIEKRFKDLLKEK